MNLYGIPNCNTVKKAREWLTSNGIDYVFIDLKKHRLDTTLLTAWLSQIEYQQLINRAGLTWKALDPDTKAAIVDHHTAILLMQNKPTVIKRPILEKDGKLMAIGFCETEYAKIFK